jgi:tetraacyldisaccharide 4'-kinase
MSIEIKTPPFWYRPDSEQPGFTEKALTPLSFLYRIGYELHQFGGRREKFNIPVICVGNINAGGSGKTPSALGLMALIKKHNLSQNPFFLSRGYGGGESGPLQVAPEKHNSWDVGDEAIVLAGNAPTIVSSNRSSGVHFALHSRADLILMDDGMQNPDIKKDLHFVVIDGSMGFGNGKLIPAGPLREPLSAGIKKADAFILIGEDKKDIRHRLPADKPIFTARLRPRDNLAPGRYLAFAGIGFPEKFFNFLRDEQNIQLADTVSYPDHYPYNEEDIEELRIKAEHQGARLVTTEKDRMRLGKDTSLPVDVMYVDLAWDDETALLDFLKLRLASKNS